MINLYSKKTQDMRDFLYTYAKRDIAPLFERVSIDGYRHVGAEDVDQFLACFNRDNRYLVPAQVGDHIDTAEAYLFDGHYYTSAVTYFEEEYITDITKT